MLVYRRDEQYTLYSYISSARNVYVWKLGDIKQSLKLAMENDDVITLIGNRKMEITFRAIDYPLLLFHNGRKECIF